MAEVSRKLFIASIFICLLPLPILYGFQHDWFLGFSHILSGLFAVISVNIMLAFYIYMASRESSDKHEPDSVSVTKAKDNKKQTLPGVSAKQD